MGLTKPLTVLWGVSWDRLVHSVRCFGPGLGELADRWLTLPGYFGANAVLKNIALVARLFAGADSIGDIVLLQHRRMKKLFVGQSEPSTLGSFLRASTFCHARQLDAVA